MKIVLQIFVDGALFLEEVTSVPAVYSVSGGGRGRLSQSLFVRIIIYFNENVYIISLICYLLFKHYNV